MQEEHGVEVLPQHQPRVEAAGAGSEGLAVDQPGGREAVGTARRVAREEHLSPGQAA